MGTKHIPSGVAAQSQPDKLTPEHHRQIEAAAQRAGLGIGDFLRYLPLLEKVASAIAGAAGGNIDVPFRGIHTPDGIWDGDFRATRRAG